MLRICQRMARADLPRPEDPRRARCTLRTGTSRPRPEPAAEGLGLMAAELVGTDPAGARKLLDEAFDRLRKVASRALSRPTIRRSRT